MPDDGIVHVVGAGLAGLSTALALTERGVETKLWEATDHAGGRCRSFQDAKLDRRIDNGNHLILTGNRGVARYLSRAGAPYALKPSRHATFPFVDLASGARFTVRLNDGPIPWWIATPAWRVPGTRLRDYLAEWRLALAGPERTVADVIRNRGPLWTAFWEPLTLAALNTTPERASARLLWRVLIETFAQGGRASRPMFAPDGLSDALVAPALRRLGNRIIYHRRLKGIERSAERATALVFAEERVTIGRQDRVVLALPPARLRAVLPEADPPDDVCAILNAHFVIAEPDLLTGVPAFLGCLNSNTHWIFIRGDVVSLTISAADRLGLLDTPRDKLVPILWAEVCAALNLGDASYSSARIITEKRATFDQSPSGVAKRLESRTALHNLFLAGDATNTGLPATIEGAIRSGETAAQFAA
ncbi:MAG: hydroxysqualene dehydroxylase HpnE [Pseudomonadota bacterium]